MAETIEQGKLKLGEYRMSSWCRSKGIRTKTGRVMPHHRKGNRGNPSRSAGKSKGIRPTAAQKWCCRAGRSYKWRDYESTMATIGKRGSKAAA